jgi:hypothetical protein
VLLAVLESCGNTLDTRFTVNKPLDLAKLEHELTIGKSTEQDVVAVLGHPSGKGGTFVPIASEPGKTFSYYFAKGKESSGTATQVERTLLYVWFDHDIYEGYMWMTSSMGGVAEAARQSAVKIYEPSELSSLKYTTLQGLEGRSCKKMLWDPDPTESSALAAMRMKASAIGANGFKDVDCSKQGLSLITNCWSSMVCAGTAIKVDTQ